MTEDLAANPDATGAPDFDSLWKEAIDAFFQPFMALFFPSVHAVIDWSQPYEFLDAELQRITGDSTIGRRYADRLVSDPERKARKGEIIALLYRYLYGRDDAIRLLRFIDWLMRLPADSNWRCGKNRLNWRSKPRCPMSRVGRFAREEGRQEGEARALLRQLQAKFGPSAADLTARVQAAEPDQIRSRSGSPVS